MSRDRAIAIPDEAMPKPRIEPGCHPLVDVHDGDPVLPPEPADCAEHLRGLHREVWAGVDPDEYIRPEREAWQK